MKHHSISLSLLCLACGESAPTDSPAPIHSAASSQIVVDTPNAKSESKDPNTAQFEELESPAPILDANALPSIAEGLVFHWTTNDFQGTALQELRIQDNGSAAHIYQATTEVEPVELTFNMKRHSLDSLTAALKENDLCAQQSTVTQAIPNDGQTAFQLNFPGLTCNVLLFNSETRRQSVKRSLNIIRAMIPKSPTQ